MPRRRKVYGDCSYCGKNDKLTRDHVIPKNLFPVGNIPSNIPIVYACEACNTQNKSGNDTYLRDMLQLDRNSSEHPVAQQNWGSFARGVLRNQSQAIKDSVPSVLVPVFDSINNFTGYAFRLDTQQEYTEAIMTMIVRGLHYNFIGGRIPETASFKLYRIPDMSKIEADFPMLIQAGYARHVKVGDGEVFECVYVYMPTHPGISIWYLRFYRKVCFGVVVSVWSVSNDNLQNSS